MFLYYKHILLILGFNVSIFHFSLFPASTVSVLLENNMS